jgi:hypothetical protein
MICCALGCVSVFGTITHGRLPRLQTYQVGLQNCTFVQPFDHAVCIFSWSFVLILCYTAAAVNLFCQHSEEQNRSISPLWIKSLGPTTDDALLTALCLHGMQNVTSFHISCAPRPTSFATIQPPVILFHRDCNSHHQLHVYDSIPHCRLGSLSYISQKVLLAKQDLLTLGSASAI